MLTSALIKGRNPVYPRRCYEPEDSKSELVLTLKFVFEFAASVVIWMVIFLKKIEALTAVKS